MMCISASAPALRNALAESISQLVPGNAGITTLGLAILTAGPDVFLWIYTGCSTGVSSAESLKSGVLTGKTPSRGSCQRFVSSFISSDFPLTVMFLPAVVLPSTVYTEPDMRRSILSPAGISITREPNIGESISPSTFTSTPILFPTAILTRVI